MNRLGAGTFWSAIAIAVVVPAGATAMSPLLAWRDPIYILAGFAGVIALTLLLFQPLLAAGYLPGISILRGRQIHRWTGITLLLLVIVHVVGLWITSPPDVIDALLFVSATPFSHWGVIAMWAVFGSVALALLRHKLKLHPRRWRIIHMTLAAIIVATSVAHAMLIEGTMETISKSVFCAALIVATLIALFDLQRRR